MRSKSSTFLGQSLFLEGREVPATTAVFLTDTLLVTGDSTANSIVVAADASGNLTVTDKGSPIAIQVVSGTATAAATKLIQVDGRNGNDSIVIDRSVNTLDADGKLAASPSAVLRGGNGNDTITPKHGGFLGGVIGNPIIGNVVQEGGNGNDTLTSGFGNDIMRGGNGNDTLIWLPGTLLDVYEGGNGMDNAVIVGNDNDQGDAFVLAPSPTDPGRVLFQRTNLIPFFVDINDCEKVTLRPQSGDDTVSIASLAGTDVRNVVVEGGLGNDMIEGIAVGTKVSLSLLGGDGNDTLIGGAGSDLLDGGIGDDRLEGRSGNDRLFGRDGNDFLSGGIGRDKLYGGMGADEFNLVSGDFLIDFKKNENDTKS